MPFICIRIASFNEFLVAPAKETKKLKSDGVIRRLHRTNLWMLLLALIGCVSMIKLGWRSRNLVLNACGPFYFYDTRRNISNKLAETQFWEQPNGKGYKPCLNFSEDYKQESLRIEHQKQSFLIPVVNGGLNQQRNQIVDAVVISRILGATLVLPILQVNQIWEDSSEFSDIFDVDTFKDVLKDDVKVVTSLPATHIMARPVVASNIPLYASPSWFQTRYSKRIRKGGSVLILRALDSRLSKNLPSDLQKLRCKVAFKALRFAAAIERMGARLAERMRKEGPYLALHLRLEKDVWVRTRCSSGLGPHYEQELTIERNLHPQLLTGRTSMDPEQRRLAGLCPLNAHEVVRLLKGLGASRSTNIYWAGGEPYGGKEALEPLITEFPNLYNKYTLSLPNELEPFEDKASSLAAIDYLVCLYSDVFMPSHGGNMAHALKGHRAFVGHRKYITPKKKEIVRYLLNSTFAKEDLDQAIKDVHREAIGQPLFATDFRAQDVLSYPVPECMCNTLDGQDSMEKTSKQVNL